ncbi:MAG: DinB family protein [Bacteroidota bacterium]
MLSIPTASEYAPFYEKYVTRVGTESVLDLLEKNGQDTCKLIRSLTDEQLNHRYGPDKWSVKEVFVHIIDTEWVMAYRALRIGRGDTTPLPGFDQNTFVENLVTDFIGQEEIVKSFEAVRRASLSMAHLITPDQFLNKGMASNQPVSSRALFYIMAGHEIHHLSILAERYGIK